LGQRPRGGRGADEDQAMLTGIQRLFALLILAAAMFVMFGLSSFL
jgi:hypothetical protein